MLHKTAPNFGVMLTVVALVTVACSSSGTARSPEPDPGASPSDERLDLAAPDDNVEPTYFATVAPGEPLLSGEQCRSLVRPTEEVVPENVPYNSRTGRSVVGQTYLSSNIDAADLEARIDGQYTGTTDEIIQWGACKWGFDEDLVRAQAYVESTWFAGKLGDCGENARDETGGQGGCSSVGLMQIRSASLDPVFPGVWPDSWMSTAFNIDYALAVKRACFEGRETWLRDQSDARGVYGPGDEQGCVGRWFSGSWYDDPANEYLGSVHSRLEQRAWENYVGCPDWETNFYCSDLDRVVDAE